MKTPSSIWLGIVAALSVRLALFAATDNVTTNVIMMWSPVTNAVSYNLYWGSASSNYSQKVSGSSSQTNLTATGLATNGIYYLAVTAIAADGTESSYSSEYVYQPSGQLLPPTGFHIVSGP